MKLKSTLILYAYAITERHDATALVQVYCDTLTAKLKSVMYTAGAIVDTSIEPLPVLASQAGRRVQAYAITFSVVEERPWRLFSRGLKLKKFLFIADSQLIDDATLPMLNKLLKELRFKKSTKLTTSDDPSLCTSIYETLWK